MQPTITVLTVDDDPINIKLVKSILQKDSRVKHVYEATNGADAMEILKSDPAINIVLLDVIMPIMNGIETLQVIRAGDTYAQIPVIMLTTDETRRTEALEFGANDFIRKPVKPSDLIQKVHTLIDL
ncbi:MAG: response regulator receiver protein [Sulfuricurvum sp. PC08-66]|nr:MAG: response regulator receiver protein [Sulfuricurvum sp. PC08-66]